MYLDKACQYISTPLSSFTKLLNFYVVTCASGTDSSLQSINISLSLTANRAMWKSNARIFRVRWPRSFGRDVVIRLEKRCKNISTEKSLTPLSSSFQFRDVDKVSPLRISVKEAFRFSRTRSCTIIKMITSFTSYSRSFFYLCIHDQDDLQYCDVAEHVAFKTKTLFRYKNLLFLARSWKWKSKF